MRGRQSHPQNENEIVLDTNVNCNRKIITNSNARTWVLLLTCTFETKRDITKINNFNGINRTINIIWTIPV